MEINTTKETLNVNKMICEKREMINIQGDMIVPDSKPDILSTINTSGDACIYKKEIMDGKIRLDGNILTYIMYLADGSQDNVRGLNTGLDFSETINIPELQEGMNVDVTPVVKLIECKVINGRKVGIKVTLEIAMKIYSKESVEIITGLNDENIQVLGQNMKVNSLLGDGTTKAFVKENISIPSTDNLAEILSLQISLVDKDIKISYNKVLAKSEVEVKIAYLTEEGNICKLQTKLPLVGFIDMPNIQEENVCETTYMIKNIIIKPNSIEEHSIYIEMEVEISCIAYEEKEIRTIQDMYCPGEKMNFEKMMVNTITDKQCKKSVCNIREKVNVPELETGTIIDVTITPTINKENRLSGRIIYEGELELNFIFTDNSAVGINTKKVSLPFEQSVDGIAENSRADTRIEVSSQEFLNQSGIVSSNLDLNFETDSYRSTSIPVINNISTTPQEELEDYSVIIYVVKAGDTLWEIAKRFGSTVDDIVRVNGIERPDRLNVGEKIYIPQYVLKRAKEPITLSVNV
ncbi:MAG: DUF3794 domain-containing protein [Clostridia bacterium]|nr:DUF3794 domain-containing protein [Clostridia bacterium]